MTLVYNQFCSGYSTDSFPFPPNQIITVTGWPRQEKVKDSAFTVQTTTEKIENGRSGGIRTHDPFTPSKVRYQAALRSDCQGYTPTP